MVSHCTQIEQKRSHGISSTWSLHTPAVTNASLTALRVCCPSHGADLRHVDEEEGEGTAGQALAHRPRRRRSRQHPQVRRGGRRRGGPGMEALISDPTPRLVPDARGQRVPLFYAFPAVSGLELAASASESRKIDSQSNRRAWKTQIFFLLVFL